MNEDIVFTKILTDIFTDAVKIAMDEGHLAGSEHFLLAFTRNEQTQDILKRAGVTSVHVAESFKHVPRLNTKSANLGKGTAPSLSEDGVKATNNSVELAQHLNKSLKRENVFVNTNLFLLALVRNPDTNAYRMLEALNTPMDHLEELVNASIDSLSATPEGEHPDLVPMGEQDSRASIASPNKNKRNSSREFITNYTELAAEGKLDPVIGREEEVERCLQILARRSKNNPVLVGEPGVGKTAVVEGIAQHLLNPNVDVPASLRNRDVWSVDVASMVAGSKYRGEFEERLKKLMAQAIQQNAILFIDEIHTILSAGNGEGAVSAGNILKPELARGKLQTIGATTHDEYRKYFEKDAALARRFHQVSLDEPSKDDTFDILKGLQVAYEAHHNVHYPDETLRAAINMSVRYMSDRFLPDKAIDLVDEAGSRAKFMKRDITDKKNALKAEIRERRNLADRQIDEAARTKTLLEARALEDQLMQLNLSVANVGTIEITPEDIATVITKITGIPVSVNSEDNTRYRNMESIIQERVIGQENAIKALSKTIRRQRSGLKDPKRPSGSFIFAGPTGVGKAQPLTSKISTPDGWKLMGDMKVGTVVNTPDGGAAAVSGVFPQGVRDVYTITFADGRTVEASDEHLWKVWSHDHLGRIDTKKKSSGEWKNLTTIELKERVEKGFKHKLSVPLTEPVEFVAAPELPLDPYILGALLGDGSMGSDIRITTIDDFIVKKFNNLLSSMGVVLQQHKNDSISYTLKSIELIRGQHKAGDILNPVKKVLSELNLLGARSWEKSIPEMYKTASVEDRFRLIQGLMDTDGHVGKTGSMSLSTASKQMAEDFAEIVHSLGGVARVSERQTYYTHKGEKKVGRISYKVSIRHAQPLTMVSLPRKTERISATYQYAETLRLNVVSVDFDRTDEVQCIMVDSADHLYITDNYVVTHNTELVKSLAEFMFGDDTALIALDMSEYGEKHTVSRLFGAPPGYVGFDEGGQLTEKVRRKPYSIILFDEIEKAHPDIFNSLLQVLEEGRLTDGQGRVVDFRNTVIVMTTNVGAEQLNTTVGFQTGTTANTYKHMKSKVMTEMKKKFKPEFLNRLDDIIVFPHLEQDELEQIVDILIANLNKRAEDTGYVIEVTPEAKTALVQEDYDHKMGARPLRRAIQSVIEDTLSEMIIAEKVTAGPIIVGHNGEEFTFNGGIQSEIMNDLNEEAVILS